MLLKDVTVLDSEPRLGQEHCFNLYDGKKAVLVAASSHAEKLCWMEDIAEAAQVKILSLWGHLSNQAFVLAELFTTLRSLINIQCTLINFLKKSSLYALIKDL